MASQGEPHAQQQLQLTRDCVAGKLSAEAFGWAFAHARGRELRLGETKDIIFGRWLDEVLYVICQYDSGYYEGSDDEEFVNALIDLLAQWDSGFFHSRAIWW